MAKVAAITGGTSGIGLAVGRALAARRDWQVYLLGTNRQRGCEVIEGIPCATFLEADVSNYDELARVFHKIYKDNGRLDFVFANAGVLETHDICARYTEDEVPPEPNLKTIDVNFKGVVYTTYLALHYFRQSLGTGVEANLIYTGSCLSFYPSSIPLYTGTKHALVGFMRSVAARVRGEAIRVNAICPGMVKTNLGGGESFEDVQHQLLVPMEYLVDVTLLLLDGREMIDAKGTRISALEAWGRAVEISGTNYYFREQLEWPDDKMQTTLSETFLAV